MIRLLLALAMCFPATVSTASAAEETWYVGQMVGAVLLEAIDGGLPGDNLEPLLEVRQGEVLSPWTVRRDLNTLERIGRFAGVEAHIQPWFWTDSNGVLQPAVLLRYLVVPSPRIRKVVVRGAKAMSKSAVSAASGVGTGDAFTDATQASVIAERVRDAYVEWGYPDAAVSVSVQIPTLREVEIVLEIVEGEPLRVTAVTVSGIPVEVERKAERVVRRAGLKPGTPYRRTRVLAAREALERLLRERGWLDVRVNPVLLTAAQEQRRVGVRLLIDAGKRTSLVVENRGALPRKQLRTLLGMDGRRRISEESLAESREAVVEMLQARGFWAASATTAFEAQGRDQRVTLTLARGSRHYLDGFVFEGATHFSNRLLSQGARGASPDVLGRLRVTEAALEDAAEYLIEFYRSQGFLDVEVVVDGVEVGAPDGGAIPLTVGFTVREGTRLSLIGLDLDGDLGPGAEVLAERSESILGQPYNPAAVAELARRIVFAHQEVGYLQADARIETTQANAADEVVVQIQIEPGPQVFLRNIVVQGQRHTRRRVIEREVTLRTGQPITPSALSATRKNLYLLGAFSSVAPTLEGDEDRVKDLYVKVEEHKRWAFEVGGGLSTDEGLSAFGRSTHRNVWGRAHRLDLLLEVGLGLEDLVAPLSSEATATPEWLAGIRYEAPNLPGRGQRLFADALLNEEEDETTWRSARTGLGIGVHSRLEGEGRLVMDYGVEYRRLTCLAPAALVAGDPWESMPAGAADAFCDKPRVESRDGGLWVSGPELLLVIDSRDDPRHPTQGVLWSNRVNVADEAMTLAPYVRYESQILGRIPVGPVGVVLGARGGVGAVLVEHGVLPLEERFRMGGATSLRGFAPDTIGPRNQGVSGECEAEDLDVGEECWIATGGDAMIGGTVELAVPASLVGLRRLPDTEIVAFVDAGTSWFAFQEVQTDYAPGDEVDGQSPWLRFGPGLGLRWATPVGPLALDLGFNPWRIQRHAEPLLRVHFALGAF